MFSRFRQRDSVTLCCFSPPVIAVTFLLELAFALYAVIRYRKESFGSLAALFLIFLSAFQFSERMICQGASAELWSRIGFIATAFLPALGLDYVAIVTKRETFVRWWYAGATAFAVAFAFLAPFIQGAECTGRFVAFQTGWPWLDLAYSAYYGAAIIYSVVSLAQALKRRQGPRAAVLWMIVAYAVLVIPTAFVYLFLRVTQTSFASVFCGFAILLAVVFTFRVLPLSAKSRTGAR